MQRNRQRTLGRQYKRAVRAFEEAQRQEIEATYRLNVARNSMDDLIRRSQNAMNAGNHPLAMTLEPQLVAATERVKQLTKTVVACLGRIGSHAVKMREAADRIGDLPN